MSHSLDQEIRTRLARYLRDETTLQSFDDWFTPATWDVDESEPVAQGLAGEISLRIAEFTNGDLSEDELKGALLPLVGSLQPEPQIEFSGSVVVVTKASSAAGTPQQVVYG